MPLGQIVQVGDGAIPAGARAEHGQRPRAGAQLLDGIISNRRSRLDNVSRLVETQTDHGQGLPIFPTIHQDESQLSPRPVGIHIRNLKWRFRALRAPTVREGGVHKPLQDRLSIVGSTGPQIEAGDISQYRRVPRLGVQSLSVFLACPIESADGFETGGQRQNLRIF